MKLRIAMEMAKCCGLTDIGECYSNISIHSTQMFDYKKINEELNELSKELDECEFVDSKYDKIDDVVEKMGLEWYYKDEESERYGCPSLREKQ